MRPEFTGALKRAGEFNKLSREELVALLSADAEESNALFEMADKIRSRSVGEEIHLRGIIEFSNHCAKNCLYCGLRRDNAALARYRMSPEEILESARRTAYLGCRTIVLQSGEDSAYTRDVLAEIVARINHELDVAITLSVGDRSREDYRVFREAGADRYLIKQETSDPLLFSCLRPGTSLEGRLKRQMWLHELGYQVGSGNMVGLPGQTLETLAGDIMLMLRLEVEMSGIGPFIPNKQTPLGNYPGGALGMTLKTLAAVRLALPYAHLPATTAVGTIDPLGRLRALQCGANVIMPNMTPLKYRENYRLYPGKTGLADTPAESYARAVKAVESLGRRVGKGFGHYRDKGTRHLKQSTGVSGDNSMS